MTKRSHLKKTINSGILMPGLFLFLFQLTAAGAPAIRYSLSESAGSINMSIIALSLDPFKSSAIKIKYSQDIDIENASVATSVSSLSVGASIDKNNSFLDIIIFQTKKISIDSTVIISLKFPFAASVAGSNPVIVEARFTDYNGSTYNVQVSDGVKVVNYYQGPKHLYTARCGFYLLSGRKVTGDLTLKHKLPLHRNDISVKTLQKVD